MRKNDGSSKQKGAFNNHRENSNRTFHSLEESSNNNRSKLKAKDRPIPETRCSIEKDSDDNCAEKNKNGADRFNFGKFKKSEFMTQQNGQAITVAGNMRKEGRKSNQFFGRRISREKVKYNPGFRDDGEFA